MRGVFIAFRVGVGLFLLQHFLRLLPYAPALFSDQGMFPDPGYAFWILFPSPLRFFGSPAAATAFVALNAALALAFALGLGRRGVALGLWYGLASLAARNFMSFNLSLNFLGWLLLACALIPPGEGWALGGHRDPDWAVPDTLRRGFWAILGLAYTVSGLAKLEQAEWVHGEAVSRLLASGIARHNALGEALLALPAPALQAMSWTALGLELLHLPLIALRPTRPLAWLGVVAMHALIGATTTITELSLAMILVQLFVFDLRWITAWAPRKR
ncbi:MAG: HTTM domain-containing protein [Alphaproteobacteria bacterium]|nr:HTTM domain-containing protein [Alphaproteobacteria bacterium]